MRKLRTAAVKATQKRTEKAIKVMREILVQIHSLPAHPCDDARNRACLDVAKSKAEAALYLVKDLLRV